MKKVNLLIAVSVLFLCCISASAQTHYHSNISLGIKGGCDVSTVFFHPSVPQKWPVGGQAGVMFRYIEENHFGLIAELDWQQRGWGEDFEDAPYHYRRTLEYIEIPVMAHIYFGRRGRFFINLGPEISFLLGEHTKANFNPHDITNLPDFPVKNRTNIQQTINAQNKIDYGITGGLGGEFSINQRNALFFEVRAYFGLGNLFSSKRQDPFSLSNALSIGASLGYYLRIK